MSNKTITDENGKDWLICEDCGWKFEPKDPYCPKCISNAFG